LENPWKKLGISLEILGKVWKYLEKLGAAPRG
jgi:hypothetical protein